jgi:uridylate kinase
MGVQVGMVIGGGNIFRGASLAEAGIGRVTGDYMGMLGTVINALAMQDVLESEGVHARVMTAFGLEPLAESYLPRRAVRQLEQGRVVLLAAGTGNPYFTTDSAAALRGIELEVDAVLKATKVDGVYSADPVVDPAAVLYDRLTYDEVLAGRLGVMDATAVVMCRDHEMPLRVFNMNKPGVLRQVVTSLDEGTLVE